MSDRRIDDGTAVPSVGHPSARPGNGLARSRFAVPARIVGWLGRTMVYGGVILGLYGLVAMVYTASRAHDGIEVLASIESARRDGVTFASAGLLDLAWLDKSGARRIEYGVKVTPQLAYKLRIGRQLQRDHVRVRYQPDSSQGQGRVIVVEDVPEQITALSILSMAGFLSVTLGAALVMLGLFLGEPRDGAREDE